MFRITSEARVVVHPRETLARAVISFDASTRAFASARLLVSPPGYDGASPSRPDEYLFAVAALASRAAFASIIARRHWVPDVRRQGTGLGTGLRDERHVHRVRLGRRSDAPGRVHVRLRRARLAASAPARGGARVPERVSSVATKHHGIARGGSAFAAKSGGARRASSRRARPYGRVRVGGGRGCEPPRRTDDARARRSKRGVGARGVGVSGARPRRRRAPPAKARLCWRGALRLRRRRVIF